MLDSVPPTTDRDDIFISFFSASRETPDCDEYADDLDFSLAPSAIIDHHNQFSYTTDLDTGSDVGFLENVSSNSSLKKNMPQAVENTPLFSDFLIGYDDTPHTPNTPYSSAASSYANSISSSTSTAATSATPISIAYDNIDYHKHNYNNHGSISSNNKTIYQSLLNHPFQNALQPLMNSLKPARATTETTELFSTTTTEKKNPAAAQVVLLASSQVKKYKKHSITSQGVAINTKSKSTRSVSKTKTKASLHSNTIPITPLPVAASGASAYASPCATPSIYSLSSSSPSSSSSAISLPDSSPVLKEKKVSDSRLSADALAKVLHLGSADEAREIEKVVLDCLANQCGFPLGYKTWVRDTTKPEREKILGKLHELIGAQFPQFDVAIFEKIIRRATYYMMQSRLRRERRARLKAQPQSL